jgi:hypothetical protein
VRDFSISAGLDASTVTPGITPPEVSRTTPAMLDVCADASADVPTTNASANRHTLNHFSICPPMAWRGSARATAPAFAAVPNGGMLSHLKLQTQR